MVKLNRNRFARSGLSLGMVAALVGGMGLTRTIALSVLLDATSFGIAMTFSLVTTLIEMTSTMGLDRLLVQAKNGEEVRFQRTLQTIQLMRGVFGTVVIFALSYPIALFFKTPDALWAYQIIAVVPLLKGLVNIDPYRQQRGGKIVLVTLLELASVTTATMVAVALALLDYGYQSMLYSILIQLVFYGLLMSYFSERPLRLAFEKEVALEAFRFGWPLQLNAMLLFLAFYADRLIIGRIFGIEIFGVFSLATSLTLTPTIIVAKTVQTLALPVLSQAKGTSDDQKELVQSVVEICIAAGIVIQCLLLPFVIFGSGIIAPHNEVLFGAMIILMSAGQTFRIAKAGPAIIHLAIGNTKVQLVANITKLLVLPISVLVAAVSNSITLVILTGIAAELCGFLISIYWKATLIKFAFKRVMLHCSFSIIIPMLYFAAIWLQKFQSALAYLLVTALFSLILIAYGVLALRCYKNIRRSPGA
jgi:O-antigen/teichoic acid export membrane protein